MSGSAAKPSDRRFGRYVILETLGAGAMGEVLRARDERLGREVALKTVRNVFGMHADMFKARFEAEARALASLSHPSIVQVHDLGIEDEEPYLVMELVDGPSLKARLARGTMTEAEVRAMGIQLARGLEAAHTHKILHRDIKPANILQSAKTGQWKLADFGVAHVPDSSVTMTGQFLGTPAYSAPEALALGQFSEASDVFALAIVLVEALSGKRLRGDATMSELVRASAQAIQLPPEVSPEMARVVRMALSLEPSSRPSAHRLAELLAGHELPASDGALMTTPAAPAAMRVAPPTPVPTPTYPHAHTLGTAATAPGFGSQPGTQYVPDDPQRKGRTRLIAALIGAVVLIGLIAALATRGGGGDAAKSGKSGKSPATTPSITPPLADAPPEEPPPNIEDLEAQFGPIEAGRIMIHPPRLTSRQMAKDFEKVAEKIRDGDPDLLDEALLKLGDFERKHGSSAETGHLRAQIEATMQMLQGGGGGDD